MDEILLYVIIGFVAQMIDGAIGMAYGVTASSVLLSAGVPPATASACVHAAETFTTGASGLAHWKLGNVDRKLLWRLAVPGMIGGAIGAYALSEFDGDTLKPFISAYLLLLGVVIIWKALVRRPLESPQPRSVAPLGFAGGLLDAMGGGGWGPIVTSSLLGQGATPRYAIGSVNLAEFRRAQPVADHYRARRRWGDRGTVRGPRGQAYSREDPHARRRMCRHRAQPPHALSHAAIAFVARTPQLQSRAHRCSMLPCSLFGRRSLRADSSSDFWSA
jgi:hypothetical protein